MKNRDHLAAALKRARPKVAEVQQKNGTFVDEERAPVCGKDFCDKCDTCLVCFTKHKAPTRSPLSGPMCAASRDGRHTWVIRL